MRYILVGLYKPALEYANKNALDQADCTYITNFMDEVKLCGLEGKDCTIVYCYGWRGLGRSVDWYLRRLEEEGAERIWAVE